jgi:A/G-specific adenine glycosylase
LDSEFTKRLLDWYSRDARDLPWRGHPDPYAVWASEIMLQQTRVEAVIPYFQRWMERFTSIPALAAASQQDVLSAWEGLGYYSRARNLHRAAQIVVDEYSGNLPADLEALRKLPGIGPYTAGAIASIAFCLMSSGAAQSGNPWPRLTAPYFIASRVISRITDSVNEAAFRETRFLEIMG